MNERTDDSEYLDPYPNELTIGGVTVAECGTPDDAGFLVQILQEEGIRSAVLLPHKRMDLRGYQVRVAPDDEVRAKLILSTPIPVAKPQAYNSQLQVEPSPLGPVRK